MNTNEENQRLLDGLVEGHRLQGATIKALTNRIEALETQHALATDVIRTGSEFISALWDLAASVAATDAAAEANGADFDQHVQQAMDAVDHDSGSIDRIHPEAEPQF